MTCFYDMLGNQWKHLMSYFLCWSYVFICYVEIYANNKYNKKPTLAFKGRKLFSCGVEEQAIPFEAAWSHEVRVISEVLKPTKVLLTFCSNCIAFGKINVIGHGISQLSLWPLSFITFKVHEVKFILFCLQVSLDFP